MVGIQAWFKQQRLKNRLVFDLFVESGIIQWRFNEYWVNPGRWLVDGFGRSRKWRKSSDPTSLKMFFLFSEYERLAMNTVCFLCSKRIGHWVKISQSSPAWGSSEPLCPSPAQSGSLRWIASREALKSMVMSRLPVICELESCQYSWEVDSNYLDTSRHLWSLWYHCACVAQSPKSAKLWVACVIWWRIDSWGLWPSTTRTLALPTRQKRNP